MPPKRLQLLSGLYVDVVKSMQLFKKASFDRNGNFACIVV